MNNNKLYLRKKVEEKLTGHVKKNHFFLYTFCKEFTLAKNGKKYVFLGE